MIAFGELYEKYQADTMVPRQRFIANLRLMSDHALPHGAFVECGTWRGGMSAAMIEVGGPDREYWFFDSFQGLPLADEADGPAATAWQSRKDPQDYYNNCKATQVEFEKTIDKVGVSPKVHVVAGWFDQTFPMIAAFPIALLRLDVDWYRSTASCLAQFWPWVVKKGIMIIDDYNDWIGCRRAVDRFFSSGEIRVYENVSYVIKEN